MTKVFYIEATNRSQHYLRRFAKGPCPAKPGEYSYHNAMVFIGVGSAFKVIGDNHPHDDPRWPKKCECGHEFHDTDDWQLFGELIYKRTDTGHETTLKDAPVGAVWDAWWLKDTRLKDYRAGSDDRCLMVKTQGGEWCIDSRASNCTMPDDNEHRCWVRHGSPEDGTLHVDKNGHTCAAGAGSIALPKWHGFLHHGHLVVC